MLSQDINSFNWYSPSLFLSPVFKCNIEPEEMSRSQSLTEQ